jgi:hypothetical protein
MRPQEIRRGLIDIVMHLFKPGSEGKRLIKIDGVYKSTDKFKPHPKTMERIALALKDWAGIGPQKTLDPWINL